MIPHEQPNDAFAWVQEPWGPALRCVLLARIADHFFTTRAPLGAGPAGTDRWEPVAQSIGVAASCLARVRQVHGAHVLIVSRSNVPSLGSASADALVTDDPAVALAVRVADCVAILAADARTGVVAAAHAGWRGTAAGVGLAAIEAMTRLGARPDEVVAAIGPSIGPCCYEVGDEVAAAFQHEAARLGGVGGWFRRSEGKLRLDLWTATTDQLARAGVRRENVHLSGLCTAMNLDLFFSYRAEGSVTGRMAGVIRKRS
ncbi:MAG: peptidoglycan editing factor PgeF [Acidobacteria bacterium]|nr:peptidoglycan editing factor PgeF [Acidobacteriota bacterium]